MKAKILFLILVLVLLAGCRSAPETNENTSSDDVDKEVKGESGEFYDDLDTALEELEEAEEVE